MNQSDEGFTLTYLRQIVELRWDSPVLVEATQMDCVQWIICGSLKDASWSFKRHEQRLFFKTFLAEEEDHMLSPLKKTTICFITMGHFVKLVCLKFFSALIFEEALRDHHPTSPTFVYLATSLEYQALKHPKYLIIGLQCYQKGKQKSSHLFYAAPLWQVQWNNGFKALPNPKK